MTALRATSNDVATLLTHQVALLAEQPQLASQLPPFMLWGAPGVGKSSIIRQVCQQAGIGFLDIRLSQREPVDLRGLPVPREQHVDWLLSGEWPRDPDSRGILLFDELTAADRSLQVAAYEIILDRRLGDLYTLPDGWLVVGAGNRSGDQAVACTFSSALANRFCHLELEPELDCWCQWALSAGLHPDVISFLRFRPENFFAMEGDLERGWPSPRSWERVSHVLNHAAALSETCLGLAIQGLVGAGTATEFLAYREQTAALPDIGAMLAGHAGIDLPKRADQRFAFATALSYHLWKGQESADPARIERFLEIGEQLPSDFATLALMDAMQAKDDDQREQRTEQLMVHPQFESWSRCHGEAFQRHLGAWQQEAA